MFELYADAVQFCRKNILAHHPLIVGLFSGAGGRFILYRPGMAPIDAPSVPIVYQLLKSVAHSTMALGEVVVPYLNSPGDLTWRSSLAAYRDRMQFALDGLDATPMRDDWRPNNRNILQNNIAFMDECLKTNAISADALQEFAKKQSPLLKKNITWAAQNQGVSEQSLIDPIIRNIPIGVIPPDEECAKSVLFFVSDYSRMVTGTALDINGGQYMAA